GAVGREVEVVDARAGDRQARDGNPARRIIKVETVEALRGHDRLRAVWGEVEVVGRRNRDRAGRSPDLRVDHYQQVRIHHVDVEPAKIVGRRDVVRGPADPEAVDDLHAGGIDDGDVATKLVRHVDARRQIGHRGRQPTGRRRPDVYRRLSDDRRLDGTVQGQQTARRRAGKS